MCVYPRVRRFLDTHKRREDREAIRKSWENTLTFPVSSCRENVNAKKSVYNMYIYIYMYMYMHRVINIFAISKTSKIIDFLPVENKYKKVEFEEEYFDRGRLFKLYSSD